LLRNTLINDTIFLYRATGHTDMVNKLATRSSEFFKKSWFYHIHRRYIFIAKNSLSKRSSYSSIHLWILYCLHQFGFTFIELMMAISVVGILATLAVPNVLIEMPKFRLHGATQQILVDLMAGRMKAISHNRKVKIFFTSDTQYKICDDANGDGTVDDCEGNAKIINIQDNYKGITFSSNNNPIFISRGTVTNLTTVSITNSSGTKSITISITGRMHVS
jgi:type IV fimbrial biogenesis protein FimT